MNGEAYCIPMSSGLGISCTTSESYKNIRYPHYHDGCELSLVMGGVHILETERSSITLRAGDVVLLLPNSVHSRSLEARGVHYTVLFPHAFLIAAADFLGLDFASSRLTSEASLAAKLTQPETERLARRIERLNLLCATNKSLATSELRVMLCFLLNDYYINPSVSSENPWFTRLLAEMKKPQNIRKGLAAMRELTPYTNEYLCREFRRMLGCTPTEYVNNARLDLALHYFDESVSDIAEVCYNVGFESISYFYTLFKAKFGMTPRCYRNTHYISKPALPLEQSEAYDAPE